MLEKLLVPSDFHKRIITLNFRDKRNIILAVFGLRKKSVKFGQKALIYEDWDDDYSGRIWIFKTVPV